MRILTIDRFASTSSRLFETDDKTKAWETSKNKWAFLTFGKQYLLPMCSFM